MGKTNRIRKQRLYKVNFKESKFLKAFTNIIFRMRTRVITMRSI